MQAPEGWCPLNLVTDPFQQCLSFLRLIAEQEGPARGLPYFSETQRLGKGCIGYQ